MTVLFGPLALKRFELLHELVPGAGAIAILANPATPQRTGQHVLLAEGGNLFAGGFGS